MPDHPTPMGPPAADRRRPPRPRSLFRIGPVAGSLLALTVLLVSTPAIGKAPAYSSGPPFTGWQVWMDNSTWGAGCGGAASVPGAPSFNASNGHFSVTLAASGHGTKRCKSPYYASPFAGADFRFTSPNLTSPVGGNRVLRMSFWLDFTEKLVASPRAVGCSSSSADSQASFTVYAYLADLTPFGLGISTSTVFGNTNSTQNGTTLVRFDALASLPMSVLLTKGHVYRVTITLSVNAGVSVSEGGCQGDYASMRMVFGSAAHPSIFRGFSIT
ncbi:MAG: hypothetical protein L3K09_07755 [Thermoplasmata archaeon]|nr:hypothetical protein [Thermoplasmata archaeon]